MRVLFLLSFFSFQIAFCQNNDNLKSDTLRELEIKEYRFNIQETKSLESVQQFYIASGKKNQVIVIKDMPANLVEKTGRQVFAKVPGAFVYDMDGSGNQLNIATRGLDPHRSWEYNVRQNGVMINSDIYGYPASHYSPPMEAIQKIELLHGTASLQYGAQFGGMINYVTKDADTTKQFSFENLNSVGSYGLFSTFNAIGGKIKQFSYYAYYQKRVSNGFRQNAHSDAQAQFIRLNYAFSNSLNLRAELGRSQYIYQIPGALTDSMFYQNPRQSTRQRNYFNPDIYVPSLTLDWVFNKKSKINWTTSTVLGQRNSVQFIGFANVIDKIDAATLQYKPRQVDRDFFNSYTSELRWLYEYRFLKSNNTLLSGFRYINNDLHRQQLGKGTTGTDFDLTITTPKYGRDIHFKTQNIAFFVENLIRINQKFQISTGIRYENGMSKMSGVVSYLPNEKVPQNIAHRFPLLGINFEYKLNQGNKLYGGWSQSYRPVLFSDIIPPTLLDKTDENLKDAFGHSIEFGVKGNLPKLKYDLTFFQILYKNRIGSIIAENNGQNIVLKTNIGDSRTNGIELYAEGKIIEEKTLHLSLFTSSAYFNGFYLNGKIRSGNENKDITRNRLETVPKWISRNGIQFSYKLFSSILQYSYVAKSYSDAFNTVTPSKNGAQGIVPAYHLWDFNTSYRFNKQYIIKIGINNIANRNYFTKRPTGYPGQGVWSSDGRSVVVSLGIKL
jgi:Fe(3+) dicitrate transport protein